MEKFASRIQRTKWELPLAANLSVPPEILANSNFVAKVQGAVLRPTLGRNTYWYIPSESKTRNGWVLDYFVKSQGLHTGPQEVEALDLDTTQGHKLVEV